MKRFYFLFLPALLVSFFASHALAQEPDDEKFEDPAARAAWFRNFYTGGTNLVPLGGRVRALQQRVLLERRARLAANAGSPTEAAAPQAIPQWIPIGPEPALFGGTVSADYGDASGRVTAIAVDPRNKDVAYCGSASGGVWKTTDGGLNWKPLTDFQASLATGSLALDPTNPDIIYVGTGENNGGGYYGAGILKSTNGGQTWNQYAESTFNPSGVKLLGEAVPSIVSLSIPPDGLKLLAAVKSQDADGIYKSSDGGVTWTMKLAARVDGVAFATNSIAYAGVRPSAGPGGLYRSADGGDTWAKVSGASLPSTGGRIEIAVSKQNPDTVYVALEAEGENSTLLGLYKTTNGGTTFTKLPVEDFCGPQCFYDLALAVSPISDQIVYVGGARGIAHTQRSLDGGATWERLDQKIHVDQHAFAFSADGNRVYLGNDGGIYRSENAAGPGSITWLNLNHTLQTLQFYPHIGMHPTDPRYTWAGSQDNGSNGYNGGKGWQFGTCGDGASAVISATDPDTVFLSCTMSDVEKSVGGGVFSSARNGLGATDAPFIAAMIGDPTNGDVLYFGAGQLFQTRDAAENWEAIAAPLAPVDQNGVVYQMAVAPSEPDIVYYAYSGGRVFRAMNARTRTAGQLVQSAEVSNGLPGRLPTAIWVDPTNANHVFISYGGFNNASLNYVNARVWESANGGAGWSNLTGDLPDIPVLALEGDPDIAGRIYIATDIGVFYTDGHSGQWLPLGEGLPHVPVTDVKLHRPSRILRASTYGRGMWDIHLPVTYAGAALVVSPPSLHFGRQAVGTSNRRDASTIQLSNIGMQPLQLAGVTAQGDFAVQATCPAALAPAASCFATVKFQPSQAGFRAGSLSIASNTTNGVGRIPLAGYGMAPRALNDKWENATMIASSPSRDVISTLEATGDPTDPLPPCPKGEPRKSVWYKFRAVRDGLVKVDTIGSDYDTTLSVSTGAPKNFHSVACNADVVPFDVLVSSLEFSATAGTDYSIMVTDTKDTGGTLVLNFTATIPLTVFPNALSLVAPVGDSGAGSFTISNTSNAAYSLANMTISPAEFSQTNNCPATLPAGAGCAVQVQFASAAAGVCAGQFSFTGNGTENYSVRLSGVSLGVDLARPERTTRPTSAPTDGVRRSNGSRTVAGPKVYHLKIAPLQNAMVMAIIPLSCSTSTAATCSVEPAYIDLSQPTETVTVRVEEEANREEESESPERSKSRVKVLAGEQMLLEFPQAE